MFSHATFKHLAKFCVSVEKNSITRCVFIIQLNIYDGVFCGNSYHFSAVFIKSSIYQWLFPESFWEYHFQLEVWGGSLQKLKRIIYGTFKELFSGLNSSSHLPKEVDFICFNERPLRMMTNVFLFHVYRIFSNKRPLSFKRPSPINAQYNPKNIL